MITTNQKEVLFKNISQYIDKYNVRSLLDIGAGDASLAAKLAGKVDRYLAVEQDAGNVEKLKANNLEAIQGTFPVELNETFDLVLVSHAIPEEKEKHEPFLRSAWEMVNAGGLLLIVTFKGSKGGVMELKNEWHGTDNAFDEELYQHMMTLLQNFGEVSMHKTQSAFLSKNLDEITNLALKTVQPKAVEQEACVKFLKKQFDASRAPEGNYMLPMEHLFISVSK